MSEGALSILHVIVRAGETNSQYNEHCLPVMHEHSITVCSLFPADVVAPQPLRLVEGDGTTWGCFRALRQALALGPYDVVHVHAPASGALTLFTYLLTSRSRRNLVFTVHNSWRNFRLRNRLFLWPIVALFPTVVTCGRSVRATVPRSLRTVFGRRISVVQNGVDLDRVDRCREEGGDEPPLPAPGLRVVSVGRLIRIKDPRTVLEAFVHAAGAHDRLVLVGDGVLRGKLAAAVEKGGLTGQIRLTGAVERDEVYRILSQADLFVSSSLGEGLPVSVLEAMACKCPVILSDIPPHREIAQLARGLPLVRPGDVAGLTDAIRQMFAVSARGRRRLGANMRRCVEEHFSVRSMNDAYGSVYRNLVARNNRKRSRNARRTGPPDSELTLPRRMVRYWPLVVALTLVGGGAGYGYAALQPPEYQAKSSVVVGEVFSGSPNDDSIKASQALAASYADLVRREPVLRPVANKLRLGDWRLLQTMVHSQPGDKNPLLIQITATADSSRRAEKLAEAVATRLVDLTTNTARTPGRDFAEREMERLSTDITRTEERIDALSTRLDGETDRSTAAALRENLEDLRSNLTELETSYQSMLDRFVTAGFAGEVQIVEHAYATPSPVRPDPISVTAAGLAAGLTLAAGLLHVVTGGRRTPTPEGPVPLQIHLGEVRPRSASRWGDDRTEAAATPAREKW